MMGYEYIVQHQPQDLMDWNVFLSKLENPRSADDWSAFDVRLTDDGIYFCDHGRTPIAAIAIRRIIDKAMSEAESVTIRELK